MSDPADSTWPHAPEHRLGEAGAYIVTAATYRKAMLFEDGPRLRMLHRALLTLAGEHGLRLQAWAVFPNHYHFVAQVPASATIALPHRDRAQSSRRDAGPPRLAQFLGNRADQRTLVFRASGLRPPKRRAPSLGDGGERVSVVLCRVVRTEGNGGAIEDDYEDQDQPGMRARRFLRLTNPAAAQPTLWRAGACSRFPAAWHPGGATRFQSALCRSERQDSGGKPPPSTTPVRSRKHFARRFSLP